MRKLVLVLVLVLAVGGAAFWWFVVRDDSPPALSVDDVGSSAPTGSAAGPVSVDGRWKVTPGAPTTAGLRIDETYVGHVHHTAVGRTDKVTGTMTVGGSTVTKASFTVDMASIDFTDNPPGLDVAQRSRTMTHTGARDRHPSLGHLRPDRAHRSRIGTGRRSKGHRHGQGRPHTPRHDPARHGRHHGPSRR